MARFCFLLLLFISQIMYAQPDRWQQRVKYVMDIDMNVNTNQFKGNQKLTYWNNSPDTLYQLFYHLYFNAFQPNSMMDTRSRELGKKSFNGRADWDPRVKDRILNLKPDEIGYQKILSLKINGAEQKLIERETILEVKLSKPILPKSQTEIIMVFEAQVPLQIRRSGRDNPQTGIRYSMSQWYPKLCEYDYDGWHPNPYIAREFYGVWGDFEVNISIDKQYCIGGTGYLQNAQEIGYGYEKQGTKVIEQKGQKNVWKFIAPNVHDFVWAAHIGYGHISKNIKDGPTIHVLYNRNLEFLKAKFEKLTNTQKNKIGSFEKYVESVDDEWNKLADAAVTVYPFIKKNFGAYPYNQYSFIQGGDGGMEYPMATLIFGPSLGTVFHEWMHTWYQMLLGTNESLYAWMDEGFTEYAADLVSQYYDETKMKEEVQKNPDKQKDLDKLIIDRMDMHESNYKNYYYLAKSGLEEPLTTHADHFNSNLTYSIASYSKGCVFLEQLGYIIGAQVRDKLLLNYYNQWKFKHPNVHDFIRLAEKTSGLKLDWYKEYFVFTTKTIDYSIDSLWETNNKVNIRLRRIGEMPMPIDVQITYADGSKELVYIPQYFMFGEKPVEDSTIKRTSTEAWKWTHPTFVFELNKKLKDITVVEIDPTKRLADVEPKNNRLELKW